jgi:hypothetical protein
MTFNMYFLVPKFTSPEWSPWHANRQMQGEPNFNTVSKDAGDIRF